MPSYTCNSCGVAFETAIAQREHMKSDWHRYNLKRRVAQLPPIDEATFNEKVLSLSQENNQENSKKNKEKQMTKKEMRRLEKEKLLAKKQQLLEMARESMLKNMASNTTPGAAQGMSDGTTNEGNNVPLEASEKIQVDESIQEDENLTPDELAEKLMAEKLKNKVDIPYEECLFCAKKSPDFESNLEHMFRDHGFYIPEQKYLVDKKGLFKYFSEKIGLGNLCLVCSYQGRSLEAVRAHMLSKNHCRIPYESEYEKLEISDFYDFSSTYEELDREANEDENQWEDVEDGDPSSDVEQNEELPQHLLYDDGVELHLPTGVKVGHRSLQRYYRQNLKPEKILSEGQGTIIAADTRHFATIYDRQSVDTQKRVWQTEVKDKKRDDKRAAKFINNQPHYRDQLLQ